MASRRKFPIGKLAKLSFPVGFHRIKHIFLNLPTMRTVTLGNHIFKKNNFTIDPKMKVTRIPESTIQFSQFCPRRI